MERGRPKLEIARTRAVTVRVTENEFEEIEKICEKLKISKTEAILRGIKLLKNPPKQKIYRSLNKNPQKHSEGVTIED
ncbi:MAG: ribbon-helix-helix protein, CopG family [Selenomonadaceae bacterium]|nr:ribbon-helix-helix protein, CopG family [Selenomonadaceae bacterium]